jgi:hypothetical protein
MTATSVTSMHGPFDEAYGGTFDQTHSTLRSMGTA